MQSLEIVGEHPIIRKIANLAQRLASTRHPVLLSGERGTGKLLVARVMHEHGRRRKAPFVVFDCRVDSGERIEAVVDSAGDGTLYLTNVEWLSDADQERALAALAARCGGDMRLILARSRMAGGGRQRELFPSLAALVGALELILPPLRERRSDIPVLVEHFVAACCGGTAVRLDDATALALWRYDWPGNVRQLREEIEAALNRRAGGSVHPDCLSAAIRGGREGEGARQREAHRVGAPPRFFASVPRTDLRAV